MTRRGRRTTLQSSTSRNASPFEPNRAALFSRGDNDPSYRKRKANAFEDHRHHIAKSRRLHEPVQPDLDYGKQKLLKTLTFPSRNQISGLPRNILQLPKQEIHNALQNGIGDIQGTWEEAGSVYRHKLIIEFPNRARIEAIGEGISRKTAEEAAYIHTLAKLHETGLAAEIWQGEDRVNSQTVSREKGSMLDVFIYAAKFGFIPTIEYNTRPGSRRGIGKTHDVAIRLYEQNISVTGRSRDRRIAEVAACMKFKQEAEKYVAEHSSSRSRSDALSPGNATDFIKWYKQQNPTVLVAVELQTTSEGTWVTTSLEGEKIGERIALPTKKAAEDVGYLIAALTITSSRPQLLAEFFPLYKRNHSQILPPVAPTDMLVDDQTLAVMQETMTKARAAGLGDQYDDIEPEQDLDRTSNPNRRKMTQMELDFRSKELLRIYQSYQSNDALVHLRDTRADYPMNKYTTEVLDMVENNLYSIIVGATGSGKTTQVPQILLNKAIEQGEGGKCNIICTQPRRIAAKSIAQRVADERAESLTNSIGYHVKRDAKLPRLGGSVTYCTTGILSAQLQFSPDEILDNVSHIIIDEVHERDIIADFLMTTLKRTVRERLATGKHVPRIILMSATIDPEMFSNYFQIEHPEHGIVSCPTLNVPGRTFPVREKHLSEVMDALRREHGASSLSILVNDRDTKAFIDSEKSFAQANPLKSASALAVAGKDRQAEHQEESIIDWKLERGKALIKGGLAPNEAEEGLVPHGLVVAAIAHILKTTQDGAILVFLPGLDNLLKTKDMFLEQKLFGIDLADESKYRVFMLHSSIPDAQKDVFDPMPPGCRKIILATNIAETSITIPDVKHVVDTGKLREKQYDQLQRITRLACVWVSKSNVKQRAGRAGRVQDGNYYALYSRERFEGLRAVGLPELLRSDLQEVCLDIRAQGYQEPVREFLANSIEPPSSEAVEVALRNLTALDCLTAEEDLTQLGRLLASLPIHPSLGKMIVLAVIFKCLDPILIIGACMNERGLFTNPIDPQAKKIANECKVDYSRETGSDHIACLNAFKEMRFVYETRGQHALFDLSRRKFLHIGAFKSINATAETIATVLAENHIIHATAPHQRLDFQIGERSLNVNSNHVGLVKALILAGCFPNMAINTRGFLHRTPGANNALIHPSSIKHTGYKGSRAEDTDSQHKRFQKQLLSYTTLAKSNDGNSTFMRECTEVSPLMACLFGGHLKQSDQSRALMMDDWLPFFLKTWDRKAVRRIIDFRKDLETMQSEAFAALYKRALLTDSPVRETFVRGLTEMLTIDEEGPAESSKWEDIMSAHQRSRSGFASVHSELRARDRWSSRDDRRTTTDSYHPGGSYNPPAIDRYAPPGSRYAQRAANA